MHWVSRAVSAVVLLLLLSSTSAVAAVAIERIVTDNQLRLLLIQGEFEFGDDPAALIRQADEFQPAFVTFNSKGGNVVAAIRFGRAIRARGLATLQIRSSECASACALAFLGGVNRFAEPGSIGVHRSSFSGAIPMTSDDAVVAVQELTALIVGYIAEMGADPTLLEVSLSVDSADMRYLTLSEMQRYRVITGAGSEPAQAAAHSPAGGASPPASADPAMAYQPADVPQPAQVTGRAERRIALYRGLDFLERDIAAVVVANAKACADRCTAESGCRLFTFNFKTSAASGPNCFLKDGQGQLDGNSAAISGIILGQGMAEPQTWRFGAIDPESHLYRNIDIPGFDLSGRPHTAASSLLQCRVACINERRCAAFTFVSKRKQCWLKTGIGQARSMPGATTGAKTEMVYNPELLVLQ